jgi:hypothetical protein
VLLSQEQWEIYKLDKSAYDCFVQAYPKPISITRIHRPQSDNSQFVPVPHSKRPISPPSATRDRAIPKAKKYRQQTPVIVSTDDESDRENGINSEGLSETEEEEVEDMVVDGRTLKRNGARARSHSAGPGDKLRKLREKIDHSRRERRGKLSAKGATITSASAPNSAPNSQLDSVIIRDESMIDLSGTPGSDMVPQTPQIPPSHIPNPPPSIGKRKGTLRVTLRFAHT